MKIVFIEPLYYTFITAFAQVVLTQRFNNLCRFESIYSFLQFQNLRDNEEEQMDRGHTVYSYLRTTQSWDLCLRSRCNEPRSILHHTDIRVPELRENIFVSCDAYDPSGFVSPMFFQSWKRLDDHNDIPFSRLW